MKYGRTIVAVLAMTAAMSASADYLVKDGMITGIASTSNNQAVFAIRVSGGTDNICEGTYISFPEVDAANKEAHARAYATALTALTAGLPVRIYNYVDSTCEHASYIEIRP